MVSSAGRQTGRIVKGGCDVRKCTSKGIGQQGIVLKHWISLQKEPSLCTVVKCPYLRSSERFRVKLPQFVGAQKCIYHRGFWVSDIGDAEKQRWVSRFGCWSRGCVPPGVARNRTTLLAKRNPYRSIDFSFSVLCFLSDSFYVSFYLH